MLMDFELTSTMVNSVFHLGFMMITLETDDDLNDNIAIDIAASVMIVWTWKQGLAMLIKILIILLNDDIDQFNAWIATILVILLLPLSMIF